MELIALDDDGIPPHIEGDVVVENDKVNQPVTPVPVSLPKGTRSTFSSSFFYAALLVILESIGRKSKKLNESALSLRNNVSRKFVERWIDGVQLQLFEIISYWKKVNQQKPQFRVLSKVGPTENKDTKRFNNVQSTAR